MRHALEGFSGVERVAHLAQGEPEVAAGVQLQRLGLGVAQPLRHVVDGEAGVLQQPVRLQHPGGGEEVARRAQPEPQEPAFEGAPVDPRARRHLLHRLQLGGRAQHLFQGPTQLTRQRGEHPAELLPQPVRGGAAFLGDQHLAQPGGVVVVAREHHVVDAALA